MRSVKHSGLTSRLCIEGDEILAVGVGDGSGELSHRVDEEVHMTKNELVEAVKAHAVENYEDDGWDYLVECYDDQEVAELIGEATTVEDAIKAAAEIMRLLDERRRDIQATAW